MPCYTEHQNSICATICTALRETCLVLFIIPQQSKMQTDQDEQQGQGDGQKETEEKAPRENEEMEVRCTIFV